MQMTDDEIQRRLREGEGRRVLTNACDDHHDSLEPQREAWEEAFDYLVLGYWTKKDEYREEVV